MCLLLLYHSSPYKVLFFFSYKRGKIELIFDLFANEKVSFIDDDYKVFEKEIIDKYDIEYLKEEMKKFIKNIKEVQYKYIGICSLKVTSNYELKVDCS